MNHYYKQREPLLKSDLNLLARLGERIRAAWRQVPSPLLTLIIPDPKRMQTARAGCQRAADGAGEGGAVVGGEVLEWSGRAVGKSGCAGGAKTLPPMFFFNNMRMHILARLATVKFILGLGATEFLAGWVQFERPWMKLVFRRL
jgi:hypothetical protein